VKVGDLIRYEECVIEGASALGLCLRIEENECELGSPERMLVMWFDDGCHTHEPLDVCEEDYMEVISESR